MQPDRRTFLLSLVSAATLAACGGGNSSSSTVASQGTGTAPAGGGTTQDPGTPATPQVPSAPPASNTPDSPPGPNVILRENAKGDADGVTSDWEIADGRYAAAQEIEGYASATSVNRGESISLYVSTIDPEYTIEVFRMGWYGGRGARRVAGPIRRPGMKQPMPAPDPATLLVECDWSDPYVLNIPANSNDPTDWASGIYLARLTGSSGRQSYIIFVVRDDARRSDLMFQSSVTTYAAYNNWGGYSLYPIDGLDGKVAYKVSFNRPYRNPQRPSAGKGAGDFLSWEIQMLRFLEREGYDVVYSTNIDTDRDADELRKHRAFLSVGHDEYWTKGMYDAIESARDHGIHLAFFGANTAYWQIRLEPAVKSQQPRRTVVAYKYATVSDDPMYLSNPQLSTYLWREQVNPPINRPEAALVGVMYSYNSLDGDMVMADCSNWICDGTGLQRGSVLRGMLGYEVDALAPSSPAGITVLAASPFTACLDTGCKQTEQRTSHMTYYQAASGAGVFATGSMNWHWGLDAYGLYGDRVNPAVQRMTRNVLNRFTMK